MARNPNQQLGYGRPFSKTKPSQSPRAQQLIARSKGVAVEAPRPLKPPHRHQYVNGLCSVCQLQEIEST